MDLHKVENLLILGNGYDLHCELNSSFSDYFFNSDLYSIYESVSNNPHHINNGNIWYLLLYLRFFTDYFGLPEKSNIKWMDVEDYIRSVVTDNYKNSGLTYSQYLETYIERGLRLYNGNDVVINFLRYNAPVNTDIIEILNSSLRRFEKDFIKYLNEINCNDKYLDNSKKLLDDLLNRSESQSTIISFNYTPLPTHNLKLAHCYNIHGSLSSDNIIIGIDSSSVQSKGYATVLTKSFQKLFRKKEAEYELPKPDTIRQISFYGHSLSQQDYSYFLSIFEHFKIEQCNVDIIFYYSKYKTGDKENREVLEEYTTAIYSLLEKYGQTIYGNDLGKNLLTKLLLKNKIMIIDID